MLTRSRTLLTLAMVAFPLSASAAPPAVTTPRLTLAQSAASLNGKRQCVAFSWLTNDKGSPRGGISVPVRVACSDQRQEGHGPSAACSPVRCDGKFVTSLGSRGFMHSGKLGMNLGVPAV